MSYRIRNSFGKMALWTNNYKAPAQDDFAVAGPSETGESSKSTDRLNVKEDCSTLARNSSGSSSHGAITESANTGKIQWAQMQGVLDGASDAPEDIHVSGLFPVEGDPTKECSNQKENRPFGQRVLNFVAKVSGFGKAKEKRSSPRDGDGGSMPGDELFDPSFNFARSGFTSFNFARLESRCSLDGRLDPSQGRSKPWHQSGRDTSSDTAIRQYNVSGNESPHGSETSSEQYRRMSTATILGRAGAMPNRCDTQSRFTEEFDAIPSDLPGASATMDAQETVTASSWSTVDSDAESTPGSETVEAAKTLLYYQHLDFARKAYTYLGRSRNLEDEPDLDAKTEISKTDFDRVMFSCLVDHNPFHTHAKGNSDDRLHCKVLYSQWRTKMPGIATQNAVPLVPIAVQDVHGMILEILRLRENESQLRVENTFLHEIKECLEDRNKTLLVQYKKNWLADMRSYRVPIAGAPNGLYSSAVAPATKLSAGATSRVDEGVDTGTDTTRSSADEVGVQTNGMARPREML